MQKHCGVTVSHRQFQFLSARGPLSFLICVFLKWRGVDTLSCESDRIYLWAWRPFARSNHPIGPKSSGC